MTSDPSILVISLPPPGLILVSLMEYAFAGMEKPVQSKSATITTINNVLVSALLPRRVFPMTGRELSVPSRFLSLS